MPLEEFNPNTPWDSYFHQVEMATRDFWEHRAIRKYMRLQDLGTWLKLHRRIKEVSEVAEAKLLTHFETFLLHTAIHLYEVGWQTTQVAQLSLGERFAESGRMIRASFDGTRKDLNFGLSDLKPDTVKTLALICETMGKVDLSSLSIQEQPAGYGQTARVRYLVALLQLADLLVVDRTRDIYFSTLASFKPDDIADARLALRYYITYIKIKNNGLTTYLTIHPDDEHLAEKMNALFEEPIRQWLAFNLTWLYKDCCFYLELNQPKIEIAYQGVSEPPLREKCRALIGFLKEFKPSNVSIPMKQSLKRCDADDQQGLIITPTEMKPYRDFELHIGLEGYIRARSDQGERSTFISVEVPDDIQLTLELIELDRTHEKLLRKFGKQLYELIFPGDIHVHLNQTEAVARSNQQKLRLRLTIEPDSLASLPWEFIYRDESGFFLAVNPNTVLSRYLNLPLPITRVRRRAGPLHLLIILSNPTDQAQLDSDAWEAMMRNTLATPFREQSLTMRTVKHATYEEIRNALLEQQPDIIQFIGHGLYRDGKGYLTLVESETHQSWMVDDTRFANIFLGADDHLGLLCLATSESAKSEAPQGFVGLAPQLVQRGVPAVVAMQYSARMTTTEIFLENFYTSIAARKPVDWAVQQARNAVSIKVGLDTREFATPVLYMRAKDGNIF